MTKINYQRFNPNRVPKRYDFEGKTTLEAWDSFGVPASQVGAVWFPELDICDHVRRINANLFDSDGNALTATSQIDAFFVRRQEWREWQRQSAGTLNLAAWRAIRTNSGLGNRKSELVGGIALADPSTPRTVSWTNFGQGWAMPSDWRKRNERDNPDPPVLFITWQALASQAAEFSASIVWDARYVPGDDCA